MLQVSGWCHGFFGHKKHGPAKDDECNTRRDFAIRRWNASLGHTGQPSDQHRGQSADTKKWNVPVECEAMVDQENDRGKRDQHIAREEESLASLQCCKQK